MTVFLGVDGGGSTCRARAIDDQGRILGEGLAGPANVTSDPDGTHAAILAASAAALGPISPADVYAVLGLAGANNSKAAAALSARLPFRRSRVVTDGHISVVGALGVRDGIVAAIGTGSVFVRQRGGSQVEIGGKGLVLGDEASGAWMGRKLMSRSLRGQDGFAPLTPLCQEIIDEFGGVEGLITFAASARPVDFARLATRIFASSDPVASEIRDEAFSECHRAIDILQEGGNLPVVCLGGLAPYFGPVLRNRWSAATPAGDALDGALAMAGGLTLR